MINEGIFLLTLLTLLCVFKTYLENYKFKNPFSDIYYIKMSYQCHQF